MQDIKHRINKLKEAGYFKEMQVTTIDDAQVIYVVVQFPSKWIIDEEIENRFSVTYQKTQTRGEYYFCGDMENGFDCVFDAIEYNIDKMLEAEERASMLTAKIKELTTLFEDESISIEALRTLEFSFPKKGKKGRPAATTSQAQIQETEEIINNNEANVSED